LKKDQVIQKLAIEKLFITLFFFKKTKEKEKSRISINLKMSEQDERFQNKLSTIYSQVNFQI